ncbi:hypothetical protein GCM10008967_08030 [Bacillus carboniphilus]|uniref:DUF6583 domain-containing protein n=1 Tax=Bacillus carboniphilus TaxID=86663 RepID=A0ABP3FP71_9BACI
MSNENQNQTRQEVAAGLETAPNSGPKPVSKKWLIGSVIAAVVLVSSIVVYGFMSNKSPKEAYLQAEYKSFTQAQEDFNSLYGDVFEMQERMENEPYTSETDISGNFDVQLDTPDPTLMMVQGLLDQINISVDSMSDLNNNKNYAKIGVELQGNTLADAEVVQDGDKLGLRVPLAYSDFLFMDTTQFGEFMRRMDPYYIGPETLNLDTIKLSDLKLTDDEKAALKETYGKLLIDKLAEENFTREDGQKVSVNGVNVKADKITLTLSEEEVQSLVADFLNTAAKDENLLNIITKRYELIVEQAQLESDPTIYVLPADELKAELVAGLQDAANSVDEIQLESGIQSAIWIDSDDTIVQREIMFEASDSYETVQFVLSTYNVTNDGKQQKEFKVSVKGEEDTSGFFAITSEIEGKGSERKQNVDVTVNAKEYGEELVNIVFSIDSDYKKVSGSEVNAVHNFDLDLGSNIMAGMDGFFLNGTVEENYDINLSDDYANQNYVFTFNVGDSYESFTVTLNVDNKTEFKKSIDVPNLDGGVNVTELSDQELMMLAEEIMYNLESAMYGLMGQFGGF